jgi:hypothetical protein
MATWTAHATVGAHPEEVLAVLTDPAAIEQWAPIPFDVDALDGPRLTAGSRARVSGCLAGKRLGFDVAVHHADDEGLELVASGPVDIDVIYDLLPAEGGTGVHASISVRGCGFTGRLLAKATEALLAGGALHHAIARIARAVETTATTRPAVAA